MSLCRVTVLCLSLLFFFHRQFSGSLSNKTAGLSGESIAADMTTYGVRVVCVCLHKVKGKSITASMRGQKMNAELLVPARTRARRERE